MIQLFFQVHGDVTRVRQRLRGFPLKLSNRRRFLHHELQRRLHIIVSVARLRKRRRAFTARNDLGRHAVKIA
jgi:hypothetical protein